jgi:anti-sigma regulatory factor (Ser/Thr protein kinase)
MCWHAAHDLSGVAGAPAAARTFVCEHLAAVLVSGIRPEVTDDAALVVSELVTNAVQAGSALVGLVLELHHGALRIEVTDDGPGWPTLQRPDPSDAHGRGLALVAGVAHAWGAERLAGQRKVVWALLVVPRELTRSLSCIVGSPG